MSCASFKVGRSGFTASIQQEKPNLVFFSIPYHEGWRAFVNGKEVKIERVNVGFMAVECGAGFSEIRFDFETPMLRLGTAASCCCLLAFAVYVLFFAYDPERGRNRRFRRFVRRLRVICHINPPPSVRVITGGDESSVAFHGHDRFGADDGDIVAPQSINASASAERDDPVDASGSDGKE